MKLTFYRNIPFVDSKFPFLFQKYNKCYWIELPFIGFKIKL